MDNQVSDIVVVGGGTAGWLTAGILAADHCAYHEHGINVTLIESPDVKTIGVGEGTWPTMRGTLEKIGISELQFLACCDAAFKQGSEFVGWRNGATDDRYYHPFVLPHFIGKCQAVDYWQAHYTNMPFAQFASPQAAICDAGLAPKQIQTPEYGAVANYGYHLNAGKFSELLKQHCCEKLGVRYVSDHVTAINNRVDGYIGSVTTRAQGDIKGQLFIDCTGSAAILLGDHYQVPLVSRRHQLFNDCALAAQIPYPAVDSPIKTHTVSTAQDAGWIWDIGLPTRKGVGYVYSSEHTTDQAAEQTLRRYIGQSLDDANVNVRKISFNPGHRQEFWHKNCVGVGMSAGFIEPLEASALALVELSANMISKDLPANLSVMPIIGERFNQRFNLRWQRIIEFLKLHYVLTERTDTAYWRDHCMAESIPERLQQLLELWRYQEPSYNDFSEIEEIFPSSSYMYVLYGMGFKKQMSNHLKHDQNPKMLDALFNQNRQTIDKYVAGLPQNRQLIEQLCAQYKR
ncbi:tryptophan halogenase family protein [Algibacillus agarilyticus]|uniref:tryptophan halogenase family protein n=1 Tax=Algibacillus agarilyticus TaxID=2234133 RepID=UPI000DCF814C|nr:tryptophan halogenase family protein [Algibacillus agarilyticus]